MANMSDQNSPSHCVSAVSFITPTPFKYPDHTTIKYNARISPYTNNDYQTLPLLWSMVDKVRESRLPKKNAVNNRLKHSR